MKQNITIFEWKEISELNRDRFLVKVRNAHAGHLGVPYNGKLPSIGQMIEFLKEDNLWEDSILIQPKVEFINHTIHVFIKWDKCLCDELWEACKNKLKI